VRIAPPDWPHRANIVGLAVEVLRTTHPHMEVQFTATPWTISEKALRAGTVDVGFAVAPSVDQFGSDLAAVAWIPEPGMSALLPARHPLASRKSVHLADLRDTPTLIPPRAEIGVLHDQMAGLIRSGGYEPKIVDSPLSYSAGAQMVAIGAGWIISTNSVAELPPPGTVVVPIEDAQLYCELCILRRADDTRDAVLAFIDACRAAAREWVGQ
jgi:DNA-binding transcriptional LysR family regulator